MALTDVTRAGVIAAIREFDDVGQAVFLDRYGFGRARLYFILFEGRRYDSKAVLGAAHGFLPGSDALRPKDFSGGEATVARHLRSLGFEVRGTEDVLTADALPVSVHAEQTERRKRPPVWAWTELVLACDLTARNNWHEIDDKDRRVVELSALLQQLSIHPAAARGDNFRSPGSVRLKMANLADCHPDSRRSSSNGSALDQEVVDAFIDRPEQMQARALEIREEAGMHRTDVERVDSSVDEPSLDDVGSAVCSGDILAEFKPKSDKAYVAAVKAQVQVKNRHHETLVRDYGLAAQRYGFTAATNVHPRDLTLSRGGRHWLVEVKVVYGGNATEAVRAVIGQLYQYRHFLYEQETAVDLVAVFSESIGDAYVDFLESVGIHAVWRVSSDAWAGSHAAAGERLVPQEARG
jgi:hypothetical protein